MVTGTSAVEQSERALMALAKLYSQTTEELGGRSLARVATIVVNRGSFFTALERGSTCSLRNFDKLLNYFSAAENWPGEVLPQEAVALLASCGRAAAATAIAE